MFGPKTKPVASEARCGTPATKEAASASEDDKKRPNSLRRRCPCRRAQGFTGSSGRSLCMRGRHRHRSSGVTVGCVRAYSYINRGSHLSSSFFASRPWCLGPPRPGAGPPRGVSAATAAARFPVNADFRLAAARHRLALGASGRSG